MQHGFRAVLEGMTLDLGHNKVCDVALGTCTRGGDIELGTAESQSGHRHKFYWSYFPDAILGDK